MVDLPPTARWLGLEHSSDSLPSLGRCVLNQLASVRSVVLYNTWGGVGVGMMTFLLMTFLGLAHMWDDHIHTFQTTHLLLSGEHPDNCNDARYCQGQYQRLPMTPDSPHPLLSETHQAQTAAYFAAQTKAYFAAQTKAYFGAQATAYFEAQATAYSRHKRHTALGSRGYIHFFIDILINSKIDKHIWSTYR